MITLVGITLVALALVGFASSALDEDSDARWFDLLLFLLVLVGVAYQQRSAKNEEADI